MLIWLSLDFHFVCFPFFKSKTINRKYWYFSKGTKSDVSKVSIDLDSLFKLTGRFSSNRNIIRTVSNLKKLNVKVEKGIANELQNIGNFLFDLCSISLIMNDTLTRENNIFGYSSNNLLTFLSAYFLDYAMSVTCLVDEGQKIERSVSVWISEPKKSRDVAECFLRSFSLTEILLFCSS